MPDVSYSLEEVREFRSALDAALDLMEANPIEDGAYTTNTQLRQHGVSIHMKWNPKLPLLGSIPCTHAFVGVGCNPALMSQLLAQLEEMLVHTGSKVAEA